MSDEEEPWVQKPTESDNKKKFISMWVKASPEEQAEILLRVFAKIGHTHLKSLADLMF